MAAVEKFFSGLKSRIDSDRSLYQAQKALRIALDFINGNAELFASPAIPRTVAQQVWAVVRRAVMTLAAAAAVAAATAINPLAGLAVAGMLMSYGLAMSYYQRMGEGLSGGALYWAMFVDAAPVFSTLADLVALGADFDLALMKPKEWAEGEKAGLALSIVADLFLLKAVSNAVHQTTARVKGRLADLSKGAARRTGPIGADTAAAARKLRDASFESTQSTLKKPNGRAAANDLDGVDQRTFRNPTDENLARAPRGTESEVRPPLCKKPSECFTAGHGILARMQADAEGLADGTPTDDATAPSDGASSADTSPWTELLMLAAAVAATLTARRLIARKRGDEEQTATCDVEPDVDPHANDPYANPYASQATPAHAALAFRDQHQPTVPRAAAIAVLSIPPAPLAFATSHVENQRVEPPVRPTLAMFKPIVIPKPAERLSDAEFKAALSRPRAARTLRPPVTVYDEPRPMHGSIRRAAGIACALISVVCFALFAWNLLPRATTPRPSIASVSVSATSDVPSIVPIEEISTRHEVLAFDPAKGKLEWKRGEAVFRRTAHHLRLVTVESAASEGDASESQTFETTDEHPFWSPEANDFVEAGKLRAGDRLLDPHGKLALVTATSREDHPEGIEVFNFRVKDLHTYFVQARGTRAPPVLVHNADCDEYVTLYHGTSKEAATNIRANGIDASKFKPNKDFGEAFYVTADRTQAQKWAARRSGGGDVVEFRVKASDLDQLHGMTFLESDRRWHAFVSQNRNGHGMPHGLDFAEGQMLRNVKDFSKGQAPVASGHQVAFYTQRAFDILMRGIQR